MNWCITCGKEAKNPIRDYGEIFCSEECKKRYEGFEIVTIERKEKTDA